MSDLVSVGRYWMPKDQYSKLVCAASKLDEDKKTLSESEKMQMQWELNFNNGNVEAAISNLELQAISNNIIRLIKQSKLPTEINISLIDSSFMQHNKGLADALKRNLMVRTESLPFLGIKVKTDVLKSASGHSTLKMGRIKLPAHKHYRMGMVGMRRFPPPEPSLSFSDHMNIFIGATDAAMKSMISVGFFCYDPLLWANYKVWIDH